MDKTEELENILNCNFRINGLFLSDRGANKVNFIDMGSAILYNACYFFYSYLFPVQCLF